jgi:hypothetical protein
VLYDLCCRMSFSENRFPLFRDMLSEPHVFSRKADRQVAVFHRPGTARKKLRDESPAGFRLKVAGAGR